MSNPFSALDFSDDENITVVKPADAKVAEKKAQPNAKLPRKELQKQEEDLRQKKKPSNAPAGQRGNQPTPDVAHPGERSKIGLKKEPHVDTHRQPADGERRGRQFERHSGTGRGREVKKGGAGGRNWGKPGDEQAPLPSTTPEAGAEGEKAEEPPVVEEDPSLTLDEYEQLKAAKRSGEAFQQKEARKVTGTIEGKAYKKDEELGEGDYIKLGNDEEAKKKPTQTKSKGKQVFEIDFKVRDTSAEAAPRRERPTGGRGGGSFRGREERPRGGGSAGAPRGGGARGGRGSAPGASSGSINTADQSAFPKLGGSA